MTDTEECPLRAGGHPAATIFCAACLVRPTVPERITGAYGRLMANKAPPSGHNKKQGKTLKEKRAAKKEKKAERSKRVI